MSFLSTLGGDIKKVFGWLTSPTGQKIESDVETAAEAIWPQITGLMNIVNSWISKVVTIEGIAVAAGTGDGTGAQKASAVISQVTPAVLAYAQSAGLPAPTDSTIAEVNNNVVAIINLLAGQKAAAPTT